MKPLHIKILTIILISGLGIIVYSNSFLCSFHFDDFPSIIDNLAIRNIHNLYGIWTVWPCRFITFLSLALNYHFSHFNIIGYHIFNLGIHLAASVLVWWLVSLTFLTPVMKKEQITRHGNLIALFSGLIFISHPLQTQAVTFIWQRAASMATLFYLASLCLYIKSRLLDDNQSNLAQRRIYYFSSLLSAILAMFCKEISITLPLIMALYEISFFKIQKNINWKPLIPFIFTLLLIPLTLKLSGSEKIWATQNRPTPTFVANISSRQYLLTEFRVMLTYIRLVFLPLHQNLDYDYSLSKNFFEVPTFCSFIFLTFVLFWAKRIFLKYRLVSFSIFWFFLTLLPESSFFPFADVIFEHRLYLPMVGASIFLVSGVYYLLGKNSINMMVIVLTMIIAVNSILTYQRNKIWSNELTLWDATARQSPHKARPFNNLGLAYFKQGNLSQALSNYDKAIVINPNDAEAYNNRGNIYNKLGDFNRAITNFNKAIEIKPQYAEAYYNRGITYAMQNNLSHALSDYNKAIEINSNYTHAYNNRGIIYVMQGLDRKAFIKANQGLVDKQDRRARWRMEHQNGQGDATTMPEDLTSEEQSAFSAFVAKQQAEKVTFFAKFYKERQDCLNGQSAIIPSGN